MMYYHPARTQLILSLSLTSIYIWTRCKCDSIELEVLHFLFVPSILISSETAKCRNSFSRPILRLKNTSSNRGTNKSRDQARYNISNNKHSYKNLVKCGSLDECHNIPLQTQLNYARDGHGVLRSFLSDSYINGLQSSLVELSKDKDRILQAYRQKIIVASSDGIQLAKKCFSVNDCKRVLQKLGVPSDDLPFLQYFNCWQHLPDVEKLCKSPIMSSAAAQLLGVEQVRLYQDSLFHKRYNDGQTPWHSDARMAPFDTSSMITFWIPLQAVPADGSGLVFISRSHSDFALPYWNVFDSEEFQRLDVRYGDSAVQNYMPLDVGDVTIHSGWTLHCANDNKIDAKGPTKEDRYALAISYVDARAEVRADIPGISANLRNQHQRNQNKVNKSNNRNSDDLRDDEDRSSYSEWIGDVKPRTYFEHKLVPIVWPITSTNKRRRFSDVKK